MSVTVVIAEEKPVTIPARATASLASFRAWAGDNDLPEKAKLLYHRGEVTVEMGKEQIYTHIRVKTEIARVLANIVAAEDPGMYLTEGVLLTNEDADVSNNPDGVFVAHTTLASEEVRLTEGKEGGFVELVGSPDMVLEIVSDSSEKKDNQTLFEAYYEAGITEYWLVDARQAEIEFHIYRRGAKKYTVTKKQDEWVRSAVFGRSFRLVRGVDAGGNPKFTLEVK